jgi:multidrug resistance efflux pump
MPFSKITMAACLFLALAVSEHPAVRAQADDNKGEPKVIKVSSPRSGIILTIGSSDKKLKTGDPVQRGTVLATLDNRLAKNEVDRARSKLEVAKLEFDASMKTLGEAELRYSRAQELFKQRVVSVEEFKEKKLTVEKFQLEAAVKKEMVNLAQFDVRRAEILLDMHVIRSPVRGVIRVIHKSLGEGVKALEPIVEIVPEKE